MRNGRSVAEGSGDFECCPLSRPKLCHRFLCTEFRYVELNGTEMSANVVTDVPESFDRRYLGRLEPPFGGYQRTNCGLLSMGSYFPAYFGHPRRGRKF